MNMNNISGIKISNYNNKEGKKDKNSKRHVEKTCFSLKYLWELLDDYCKFSSLHGLRYIRDSSIPKVERLFWLGIFLTCLYVSGIVVWNAYLSGVSNEFQLVYNPKSTKVFDIPFPAVLVCSAYPIRRSVFDIDKQVDNAKFKHFSKLICSKKFGFGSEVFNGTINEDFFDFIRKAAIPCQDLIVNCHWKHKVRDCCTLFKPIITGSGLCYVFNSLPGEVIYKYYTPPPGVEVVYDDDLKFWDVEKGYPNRDGAQAKRVRPFWVELGGPFSGFSFDLIDLRKEWQFNCSGAQSGFKVYIYPPDLSFETVIPIRVPHKVHSYIQLDPIIMRSEDSLRSIDLNERQCLFRDEFQLEYFNHYEQSSCQVECLIKTSIRLCGCAPFVSHRLVEVFSYEYCNDSSQACFSHILDHLSANLMTAGKNKSAIIDDCKCLPSCSWLNFDFQTSFQKLSSLNIVPALSERYSQTSQENSARLSIYYNHNQFNSITRQIRSDLTCAQLLWGSVGIATWVQLYELL